MCALNFVRCDAGQQDELTKQGTVTELAVGNNKPKYGETRTFIIRTVNLLAHTEDDSTAVFYLNAHPRTHFFHFLLNKFFHVFLSHMTDSDEGCHNDLLDDKC